MKETRDIIQKLPEPATEIERGFDPQIIGLSAVILPIVILTDRKAQL